LDLSIAGRLTCGGWAVFCWQICDATENSRHKNIEKSKRLKVVYSLGNMWKQIMTVKVGQEEEEEDSTKT